MKRTLFLVSILGGLATESQAKMRYVVDDFGFEDMVDDQFAHIEEHVKEMKKQLFGFRPNKEEREALKTAQERLAKIKPTIESDEQNVIITFALEGVNKKDIKVVKKSHGLLGTIPTHDGQVEFYLSPHYLETVRHIEIKKEQAKPADQKDDKQKEAVQAVSYYSSSATEVKTLPAAIDIQTAQAETKDATFTIIIARKKEALLPVSHK